MPSSASHTRTYSRLPAKRAPAGGLVDSASVKAIAKVRPEPGVEIIDVPEPTCGRGEVLVKLKAASVCGTDLHIYAWDPWASSRIKPPRIIGHEFCGTIEQVGPEVDPALLGQFISSESHIVCGTCLQCRSGQAHVCVNTKILGVDVDGGFAPYVSIPVANARLTDPSVPPEIAAFQDALGNAVHTAFSGPVKDQVILITGMGPIGLFAASVCKASGARLIISTEVSPYRIELAKQIGVDVVLSPLLDDVEASIERLAPGGVDGVLEMSGHPSSLALALHCVRPGGRISLLGLYADSLTSVALDKLIFKGIQMQGIVGRRLYETWDQMSELLKSGNLRLEPVITHRMHYTEFQRAMELMQAGQAGKVVFFYD